MFALVNSMISRTEIWLQSAQGMLAYGIVNAIEAEDGSGRNWNVRLNDGQTYYLRNPQGSGNNSGAPIASR